MMIWHDWIVASGLAVSLLLMCRMLALALGKILTAALDKWEDWKP